MLQERVRVGEFRESINGIELHFSIQGSGPVLFVHAGGPGIDARTYENWGGLSESFTLVVIHPRGSGLSSNARHESEYRLEDYVEDLEALRHHLGLERILLLGHSHGGFVALSYAAKYQKHLTHLILLNTGVSLVDYVAETEAGIGSRQQEPWFQSAFEAAYVLEDLQYDQETLNRAWNEMMPFYFGSWNEQYAAYRERTSRFPMKPEPLKTHSRDVVAELDLRACAKQVDVPTLILTGDGDIVMPPRASEDLKNYIPHAHLKVLDNCGHMMFVEAAQELKQSVEAFTRNHNEESEASRS